MSHLKTTFPFCENFEFEYTCDAQLTKSQNLDFTKFQLTNKGPGMSRLQT